MSGFIWIPVPSVSIGVPLSHSVLLLVAVRVLKSVVRVPYHVVRVMNCMPML